MSKTYHQKVKHSNFLISDDGEELIAFPISEYNVQLRILKKDIIKKFAEKCVNEMKEWYWNEELHDKTTDPLIIDDMTSNAIITIRRIVREFDGEQVQCKHKEIIFKKYKEEIKICQ